MKSLRRFADDAGPAWEVPRDLLLGRYPDFVTGGPLARGDIPVQAWASVHIIANVLKNAKTVDGAGLIAAMEAAGPIDFAPVAPFDWSKPSPAFLPRRVFSTSVVYSTVKDGKLVTDGKFVDTAAG